jgi:hypothetical protein
MIDLAVVALSVLLPPPHLALTHAPRTMNRVVRLLLVYAVVLDVGGIGFVFGFIPHVFSATRLRR